MKRLINFLAHLSHGLVSNCEIKGSLVRASLEAVLCPSARLCIYPLRNTNSTQETYRYDYKIVDWLVKHQINNKSARYFKFWLKKHSLKGICSWFLKLHCSGIDLLQFMTKVQQLLVSKSNIWSN